jgi:ankyrin repeat protein
MCGAKKIDGYAFSLGVDLLRDLYEARPDLQGLIRLVTYLIREAIFRTGYLVGSLGRSSLDICSLGELMDMYHAHEATKRHDKVYALLGMSSDDLSKVDLLPDYGVPWEELLQRLAKFLLPEKISVETWRDREITAFKSKGCVLGKVTLVQSDMARDDRQGVDVTLKNIPGQPEERGQWSAHWTLSVSARPIREGDLICLLQGASKLMIVRLCNDHFAIIMIAATPQEDIPTLSQSENIFTRDFLLVWDWESSLEKHQDQGRYETLLRTNSSVSECSKTELESYLDDATRIWNVALILGDSEENEEAGEKLQEAVNGYEITFGEVGSNKLGSQYDGQTPLVWAAGNGYYGVVNLLLTKDGIDPDLNDRNGRTPLWWAAKNGHETVVKLLLETGKVDVDSRDSSKQTPLWSAAMNGHEAVVKLLLETGKVYVNSKDSREQTPLWWAAKNGHETVVKLLLETGKVDVDSRDSSEQTPLWWAAKNGHETVVKLLLETGKVSVDSKDSRGRTPLSFAAQGGHETVVKLLLETGKVDVDSRDSRGWTPLWWAAQGGHETVVKLLLETGKVSVDLEDSCYGRTPLLFAAQGGYETVVKLLLETGKVDVDSKNSHGWTPLWLAAVNGHETVVKLLLETGKVDVDSRDSRGQTLLQWAAERGHEAVVKLLLETGKVSVDSKDSRGRTPLSFAAQGGHETVVKLLLETGKVDVNSKDSSEQTPLWWAAKNGHEAVVKLLESYYNLS